tara:strand:+ start:514 stop:915 length:402 start_codon:yes stop_codon:yes gene_type:complete
MAAGIYDFTIEQGTTINFEIQYRDNRNCPIDLTNYQGRMQIRPFIGATSSYITLSSSLDDTFTGINFSGSNNSLPPSSGSIAIQISATSSSVLDWSIPAYYDLEIYSGSGANTQVTRVVQGRVRLSKEVTLTP